MPRPRETVMVQGKPHVAVRDYHTGVLYILGNCCGCNMARLISQVRPDVWRCDDCAPRETL